MPFVSASDSVAHTMHGARFVSYASSATGSKELCAWRLEMPAGSAAPAHRISREEVFLVLSGSLALTIDQDTHTLTAGDVAIAPAGSTLEAANPAAEPAEVWVTTSTGLEGELPDGSRVSPPWAN